MLVICGNKNDQYELEEVPEKEAMAFAREIGAIFKTTSAKTYSGIEDMFKLIGKKILNPKFQDTSNLTESQKHDLKERQKLSANKAKQSKGCC